MSQNEQRCHVPGYDSNGYLSSSKVINPVDLKPKGIIAQILSPLPRTDRDTKSVVLFGVLRSLGLGDQVEHYEMYLAKKYGHSSKDLTPGEISEQFITLCRCKRDAKTLKQLTDYFAALKNYRKAA